MTDKILSAMEGALAVFEYNGNPKLADGTYLDKNCGVTLAITNLRAAIEQYKAQQSEVTFYSEVRALRAELDALKKQQSVVDMEPIAEIRTNEWAIHFAKALIERLTRDAEPVAWIPDNALEQLKPPLLRLLDVPLLTYDGEGHTALYLHPPLTQQVPEGYVLVPIEPTVEMREAMQYVSGAKFSETKEIYKAMIAAAPNPEESCNPR